MRKWILAAAAAAIFAAPVTASAQQPMVIKFSHVVAEKTPKGRPRESLRRWPSNYATAR